MDTLIVLNVIMAVVNLSIAIYQGVNDYREHQKPQPHPLDAQLRDIAAAIRERP